MDFQTINWPYNIPQEEKISRLQPVNMWKVYTDSKYQPISRDGFPINGIFITLSGRGELYFNTEFSGKPVHLNKGTLYIVRKETPCSYRCSVSETWRFYFFSFSGLTTLKTLGIHEHTMYQLQSITSIEQRCRDIEHELIINKKGSSMEVKNLFSSMLIYISRSITGLKGKDEQRNLDSVLVMMRKDIHNKFDCEKLQALSGLSRTAFFTRFREITGTSPGEYFLGLKVKAAKGQLTDTVKSIKEIAWDLGFYDSYHFSRVFKKATGQAPCYFRKRYKSPGSYPTFPGN